LPGLIACLALFSAYFRLNFALAAQRDWQTIWLVAMGLMGPSMMGGRAGRLASAACFGLATCFRPQAVLFAPAMLLASCVGAADRRSVRGRVVEWVAAAGATSLLVFMPLLVLGIADDLVRNLSLVAYGGPYSRTTPGSVVGGLVRQGLDLRFVCVPVAVVVLCADRSHWSRTTGGTRSSDSTRPARMGAQAAVWLAAAAGVALYKPIHPVPHDYLDLPAWVVWSGLVGVLVATVLDREGVDLRLRLVGLAMAAGLVLPGKPDYCNPRASLEALTAGPAPDPGRRPPGYEHHMSHYQVFLYPWEDYARALDHLRERTSPATRVANALTYQVALNGASGRRSAFRNESGLLWLTQTDWPEERFVSDLEAAGADSVVVWDPGAEGPDDGFRFPGVEAAIRRLYEPEARYGAIEIWRRRG
jgi:hypothetical protein